MIIENMIKAFKETESIRAASRVAGCCWQRTVKILTSNGIVINEKHKLILELHEKGKSPEEIAKQIGCTVRTVKAYLPPKRPCYMINQSENAKMIKQWREIKNK